MVDALASGRAFDAAGLYQSGRLEYRSGTTVESVDAASVSAGLFDLLGVKAIAGRLPVPADEQGEMGVAVIGEHLWHRRFAGSHRAIGQVLDTGRTDYTIIGVAPATLDALGGADVFLVLRRPTGATPTRPGRGHIDGLIGRVRPGADDIAAAKEVAAVALSLPDAVPDPDTPRIYRISELLGKHDEMLGWGAALGVVLLLLMGTVNAALLYVGWLEVRRLEVAIRMVLGAGPARLLRQFIGEWFGLVLISGTLGFVLSLWAERLVGALLPAAAHYLREPRPWVSGGFAAVATALSAVAIGVVGYLSVVRPDVRRLASVLSQTGSSVCGAPRALARRILVTVQIGIGVALLSTSVVLSRSLAAVVAVSPGFDPGHMMAFSLWRPPEPVAPYPGPGKPTREWIDARNARQARQRQAFFSGLLEACGAVPGVEAVGGADAIPWWSESEGMRLFVDDGNPRRGIMARVGHVAGDYFRAAGIQIRRGRVFRPADAFYGGYAVVDEVAAARLWPGIDPIGRQVRIAHTEPREVIGVVAPVRSPDPRETAEGAVYLLNSHPVFAVRTLHIVARATRITPELTTALREAVRQTAPDTFVFNLQTGRDIVEDVFSPARAQVSVLWLFAGLATILCIAGVFGSTTQWLLERRREMVLRVVLGASRRRVVGGAVRQVGFLTGCGAAGGIALAWAALRLLRTTLLGVQPTATGLLPGVVLAVVAAIVTGYVAAWRVTSDLTPRAGR